MQVKETFEKLPPIPPTDLRPLIRKALQQKGISIIVLDDDPTGTQTVYDLPVLTHWDAKTIREELERDTPVFYILTNSRSFPAKKADDLNREIGTQILQAGEEADKKVWVISRSDSTLRGHYPNEVDALAQALEIPQAIRFIIPAFFEGGRFTIGDTHYVQEGDQLIPASETPFAQDKSFGFQNADLKKWIEEKTEGKISAESVYSVSIDDLREKSLVDITHQLERLPTNATCIVNAADYYDLQTFCLALLQARNHAFVAYSCFFGTCFGSIGASSSSRPQRANYTRSKRRLIGCRVLCAKDDTTIGAFTGKCTSDSNGVEGRSNFTARSTSGGDS